LQNIHSHLSGIDNIWMKYVAYDYKVPVMSWLFAINSSVTKHVDSCQILLIGNLSGIDNIWMKYVTYHYKLPFMSWLFAINSSVTKHESCHIPLIELLIETVKINTNSEVNKRIMLVTGGYKSEYNVFIATIIWENSLSYSRTYETLNNILSPWTPTHLYCS